MTAPLMGAASIAAPWPVFAMTDDGQKNGGVGISARGRFERMEDSLARIEGKLDGKASTARVEEIAKQVALLERIDSNRVAAAEALRVEKDTTASMLKEVGDMRYRTLVWVVGIATLFSIGVSITLAVTRLMP